MATNNCGKPCGCTDTYVVTPACPPTCPTTINSQCVVYTGTDILCNDATIIARYDFLDAIIAKLTAYVCTTPKKFVVEQTLAVGVPATITHNLGTVAVQVQLIDITTNALVSPTAYTVTSYALNTLVVTRIVGSGNTRIVIIG
jgi:hypothetical protein